MLGVALRESAGVHKPVLSCDNVTPPRPAVAAAAAAVVAVRPPSLWEGLAGKSAAVFRLVSAQSPTCNGGAGRIRLNNTERKKTNCFLCVQCKYTSRLSTQQENCFNYLAIDQWKITHKNTDATLLCVVQGKRHVNSPSRSSCPTLHSIPFLKAHTPNPQQSSDKHHSLTCNIVRVTSVCFFCVTNVPSLI